MHHGFRVAMGRRMQDIYEGFEKSRMRCEPASARLRNLEKLIPRVDAEVLLDVGCYDGSVTSEIRKTVPAREAIGLDFLTSRLAIARQNGIEVVAIDIDQSGLPIKDESVDFVFVGDLIEHIYSPDLLLREIWRVMKEDGMALMSTPNLGSWKCRISLLFGYQPPFTEVSTVLTLGNPFIPKKTPSGHIRVMTYRALNDLLSLHRFHIVNHEFCTDYHDDSKRLLTTFADAIVKRFRPSMLDEILVVFAKTRSDL